MTALMLLSLLLLSSASWSGVEAKYRLENQAVPIKYILEVEPDLETFKFKGSVMIVFEIKNLTSLIVLNQRNLTIKAVEIENNLARVVQADDDQEILTIYFKEDLKPYVAYSIKINYEGVMNDQKLGLYKTSYYVGDDIRWIAATHFQPTGARLVFPCWDEPEYRAIFEITIRHLAKYTAVISNMPKLNTIDDGRMKVTVFPPTKPMSTYLVAFVVSDYAYRAHPTNDTFKIYTKPESIERTSYALDFSVKAMEQLDILTGIKYSESMPKMDLVAIKDIGPVAMENWGLVTFRGNSLLYEEGIYSNRQKEKMSIIIAHEFAHQWFGNLVSTKWWEFIWLNEGIATYYNYYIVDKIEPSWRLMEMIVVDMQQVAFYLDGIEDSRALNHGVDNPSEISDVFGGIVYKKGGSIIRMMSHILTEEVFVKGMRTYLKDNELWFADSNDLILQLQAAAGDYMLWDGVKLSEIMKTWITKPGYPVVTVKQKGGNYVLTQERFMYYECDDKTTWWVPITYVTKENLDFSKTVPTSWISPTDDFHELPNVNSDWIIVNNLQTGYYRVNYEKHIWEKITQYLITDSKKIHPITRAQLIDDALNLARRNLISYTTALNLTLYLKNETDYIPWMSAFRNLDWLRMMLSTSKQYHIFEDYVRYIMQGLTKYVKYTISPQDSHTTKILKTNGFRWACTIHIKECIDPAKKEFDTWVIDDKYELDANLKYRILCTGLKTANETLFKAILKRLTTSTFDVDDKDLLLRVAGCSQNRTILEKVITESLKTYPAYIDVAVDSIVTNNQVFKPENLSSVGFVLNKLEEEYKTIAKLEGADQKLETCMYSIANAILDEDDIIKMHRFIIHAKPKPDVLVDIVETTARNVDWVLNYRSVIEQWLVEHEEHFKSTSTRAMITSFLVILPIFIPLFY